ncbi:ABC transporter ATP-binding protein [Streptomyces sp. NPDC001880]
MSGRPPGLPIEVNGLTKRFGRVSAVEDLSFTVRPGVVTGFLGPNGAGKTTTMRMILGLVAPTAGTATIGRKRYTDLPRPSTTVGAVLDASAVHPGHSARDHLHIYRTMGGHPAERVDRLLTRLGLDRVADRRTRTFSTGMRQRLGLATALLGDPQVLLLDEPGNGLDPEGIAWLRGLLRGLAAEGRTVLVSSHVLSEVQQIVDDVVVIREGRLVAAGEPAEIERLSPGTVLVRSPDAAALRAVLLRGTAEGGAADRVDLMPDGTLCVHGMADSAVADLAAAERLRVYGLSAGTSLEQLFLRLAGDGEPAGRDRPPALTDERWNQR